MFPGICLLPTQHQYYINSALSNELKKTEDVYTKSFFKQFTQLQKLSINIFIEIDTDINKLFEKFESISAKIEPIRRKAEEFIKNTNSPEKFMNNKHKEITIPPLENITNGMPGQSSYFINYVADGIKRNVLLEPFKDVLPDYKELELQISDPNFYRKQLHNELAMALSKELAVKKTKNKKIGPSLKNYNKFSNAMFELKMANESSKGIDLPVIKLGIPPPPGETDKWRDQVVYTHVIKKDNKFVEQAIQTDQLTLVRKDIHVFSQTPKQPVQLKSEQKEEDKQEILSQETIELLLQQKDLSNQKISYCQTLSQAETHEFSIVNKEVELQLSNANVLEQIDEILPPPPPPTTPPPTTPQHKTFNERN